MRKAREVAGFSDQGEFAAALGVSRGTVSNAERDTVKVRTIVLRAWAMATGVPVEWLETGTAPTDNPPAPPACATRDSNPEPAGYAYWLREAG